MHLIINAWISYFKVLTDTKGIQAQISKNLDALGPRVIAEPAEQQKVKSLDLSKVKACWVTA